jgi:hypothetical protein
MNFGIPFALGFEKVFQRGILILSNPQLIHQHFYKRSIFIRKSGRRRRTTGLIGMVFALLLLFSPSFACAVQITLAWDSNVEPDVAGYIVYYISYTMVAGAEIMTLMWMSAITTALRYQAWPRM